MAGLVALPSGTELEISECRGDRILVVERAHMVLRTGQSVSRQMLRAWGLWPGNASSEPVHPESIAALAAPFADATSSIGRWIARRHAKSLLAAAAASEVGQYHACFWRSNVCST